jgi:hypothetical protein
MSQKKKMGKTNHEENGGYNECSQTKISKTVERSLIEMINDYRYI